MAWKRWERSLVPKDIKSDIKLALQSEPWIPAGLVDVQVLKGVAILHGTYDTPDELKAIRVLVENVPGVREIDDRRVRLDMMFAMV